MLCHLSAGRGASSGLDPEVRVWDLTLAHLRSDPTRTTHRPTSEVSGAPPLCGSKFGPRPWRVRQRHYACWRVLPIRLAFVSKKEVALGNARRTHHDRVVYGSPFTWAGTPLSTMKFGRRTHAS